MRIYATYNIKGGVGKTTTAVNLGYLAAEAGLRTVLWDLDPQGAASMAAASVLISPICTSVSWNSPRQSWSRLRSPTTFA